MAPVNLEKLIPGLTEEREKEKRNRGLAFAGLTHSVCGFEVNPLTPGHRLELQLLENAFTVVRADPTLVDVFVFLWVLSPLRRPGIEAAREQYFLRADVQKLDLNESVREIYRYLINQVQDSAEASSGGNGTDQSAWIHWMAMDAAFWLDIHGGFTLQSYRETPYLVLQQLYRAWKCNHPDMSRSSTGELVVEEPQFINASDKLISQWQRQHRAAVAEHIRNQHTRLN